MSEHVFRCVEVLNRLKRGTSERRVIWQHASDTGCFQAALENGHAARIGCAPSGTAVNFTMTGPNGAETLHLDSALVPEDLLRLAILQLFVTVRDACALDKADAALDAVRDL